LNFAQNSSYDSGRPSDQWVKFRVNFINWCA